MIRFTDVSMHYGDGNEALRRINLYVEQAAMVYVTGRSGAGKSSLLRLVALIERHNRGQIIVNGQNLERVTGRRIPLFRRNIGFMFQDHRLLYDRSVFDNIALPLVIAGYRYQEIRRRVHAAMDKVGLLKKEKSSPVALSGGEQQRVGIARAVVHRPALLLADEPTGNLDPGTAGDVFDVLLEDIESEQHGTAQHVPRERVREGHCPRDPVPPQKRADGEAERDPAGRQEAQRPPGPKSADEEPDHRAARREKGEVLERSREPRRGPRTGQDLDRRERGQHERPSRRTGECLPDRFGQR